MPGDTPLPLMYLWRCSRPTRNIESISAYLSLSKPTNVRQSQIVTTLIHDCPTFVALLSLTYDMIHYRLDTCRSQSVYAVAGSHFQQAQGFA